MIPSTTSYAPKMKRRKRPQIEFQFFPSLKERFPFNEDKIMKIRKPIDFEAIASMDKPLDDQLDQFLYEKEGMLGECIVHSIHIVQERQLPDKAVLRMKLSEALEVFEKRIRQLATRHEQLPTLKDFQMTTSLINSCLWHYVETLESCVVELFQQLEQMGLEKWHKGMFSVVSTIKVLLLHKMEDVSWAVRRMEVLLWQYRAMCAQHKRRWSNFQKWLPWSHLLDKNLISNLEKTKKYLNFKYNKFTDRMTDYDKYCERIDQSVEKFKNYHVFNYLDSNDKTNFKRIYDLLKLWEINLSSQSLPNRDIVRSLRHIQNEDKVYQLFEDYYDNLKEVLFNQSRLFKLGSKDLWEDPSSKTVALDVIAGHRKEVHNLGSVIQKYRDFLLRTDPNPYIRSRLGFAEWIVGPEPTQTKKLLNLIYKIEELEELYKKLHNSLEKGPSGLESSEIQYASPNIERSFHEISQPLTSRAVMHTHLERMINILYELDELGSFNRKIIDFFSQILSKILRADWKYNVVFDIPKFDEIYQIHQGLVGPSEDRQHLNRKSKFSFIFQQIQDWTKKKITQRHVQEIEQDVSDIKINLQDFLAFVQRMASIRKSNINDEEIVEVEKEVEHQLLEYRYQFGKFFHQLSLNDPEERSLRNQFLFVHQYFEAVENTIHETE